MKILHCLHTYLPYSIGGVEIYVSNLTKAMAGREDVRIFFVYKDSRLPEFFTISGELNGSRFYAVNRTFSASSSLHSTLYSEKVETAFKNLLSIFRPHIVHFHHVSGASFRLPVIAKEFGCSVFWTLHDYHLICPRGQLLDERLRLCEGYSGERCGSCLPHLWLLPKRVPEKMIGAIKLFSSVKRLKEVLPRKLNYEQVYEKVGKYLEMREKAVSDIVSHTDIFIAPSRFLKEKFERYSIWQDANILHLIHGVPDMRRRRITKKGKRRRPLFIYAGALIPSKGIHILLDAIRLGRERGLKAEFRFYGSFIEYPSFGGYGEVVRNKSRIEGVSLYPHLPHRELVKIVEDADCTLLPSLWWENAPLIILESLSLKTPVIASRTGGIPELFEEGRGGLFAERGDIASFSEKLMMMEDKSVRTEIVKESIPPEDLSVHVEKLRRLYRSVS